MTKRSFPQSLRSLTIIPALASAAVAVAVAGCGSDPAAPVADATTDVATGSDANDVSIGADVTLPDGEATDTTPTDIEGMDTTTPDAEPGDTAAEDVVTPAAAPASLVAWSGLDPNGPNRGGISVSTSNGTSFGPFQTWKAGSDPAPVVFGSTANRMADVDGDGHADLIAWSGFNPNGPQRGGVSVHLSTGAAYTDATTWKAGNDQAPVVFGTTANLAGDVDGDGKADLIAWSSLDLNSPNRGAISVHLSTGAAFADAVTWLAGTNPAPVPFGTTANLAGDVDGDGKVDLVAWSGLDLNSPNRGNIGVILSTGTAFGDAISWKLGTNEAPIAFGNTANLIGDVNGDGKADLVAFSAMSLNSPDRGAISVYLSTGTAFANVATWLAGTNEVPIAFGTTANLLTDVNGDGKADLIAWSGTDTNGPNRGGVSVFLSTGTSFAAPTTWFAGTNEAPTAFGTTGNLAGTTAE